MLQYFCAQKKKKKIRNVSAITVVCTLLDACIMLLVGVDNGFNQNALFSQLKTVQFIELTLIILYYTTQKLCT